MTAMTAMPQPSFTLSRSANGRLVLTNAAGETFEAVMPVRAFPISAPDGGLSLVSADGHELVWIERLDDLPEGARQLVAEELASREFMPQIQRIRGVSSFVTPSTWEVDTDRGPTTFVLKGEEDIRRLAQGRLLIADSHGIHFLIRDPAGLDKASRKILDRFL